MTAGTSLAESEAVIYIGLWGLSVLVVCGFYRTRAWWVGGTLQLCLAAWMELFVVPGLDPTEEGCIDTCFKGPSMQEIGGAFALFVLIGGVICLLLASWRRRAALRRARIRNLLPMARVVAMSKDRRGASESAW